MSTAVLIVAAGRGERAGGDRPKQYQAVAGRSILARTLDRFDLPAIDRVVIAANPEHRAELDRCLAEAASRKPVAVVDGGASRAATVCLALEHMAADPPDRVLIHDAARPFVSARVIEAVIEALSREDGACASIPIVDALRRAEDGLCGAPVPRENVWRAQTPQGFRFEAILAAHRATADDGALDDAEVARAHGLRVAIVESDADNFKITRPGDFARAERLLAGEARLADEGRVETRMGTGFDVHRFGPGDHLMLCGVRVPHEKGFIAHSDGDVGLHALTDAVLGAVALGDIGQWFPPSDPRWAGAASDQFLAHALGEAAALGFRPVNLDVTLICERPKIGPHATEMRAAIARIVGCEIGRVSVKATTSERLGFTGRGEGIAAQAAAVMRGIER
jgi:2-C-methyl-D-erythritol 4-phosphate cytidylyltransferase/2-C-methyl-D-erythritol 2,4-cyclodiphosphate synthase